MKAPLLLVSLPIAAALAFVPSSPQGPTPQDPQPAVEAAKPFEHVNVMSLAELQYTNLQGKTVVVSARNVVEIRLFDDLAEHVRLELLYDNGDYSLIDAQAIHLLRNGASTREVRLVRTKQAGMRFPRMP